jgi:hypothetical protein
VQNGAPSNISIKCSADVMENKMMSVTTETRWMREVVDIESETLA